MAVSHRDAGFVGAVEVVYLTIAALVMVVFLGYLGRRRLRGVLCGVVIVATGDDEEQGQRQHEEHTESLSQCRSH